jgi:hypothetical protein
MDKPRMEAVARALVIVGESAALAARQLREALMAYEEAVIREAVGQIEEDEKLDPFARLLQAMEDIRKQVLMEELAVDPADLEPPRKVLRPPKRIGPINKVNYTASRPPKRARSSCYRCRH